MAMLLVYATRLSWRFCGEEFHATHVIDSRMLDLVGDACEFRVRDLQGFREALAKRDPFSKRARMIDMGRQLLDADAKPDCKLAVDLPPL